MSDVSRLAEYRADAEAGIARCDGLIEEAKRDDSPLAVFLPKYVEQRRAFQKAAAHYSAQIDKLTKPVPMPLWALILRRIGL